MGTLDAVGWTNVGCIFVVPKCGTFKPSSLSSLPLPNMSCLKHKTYTYYFCTSLILI